MTAPVRTLGVKFTADGSDAVRQAIAQVAATARTAADTAARAAAATARQLAETQQAQAMAWQRNLQAAERAAYAEQSIRDAAAARARAIVERTAAAQTAAAAQVSAQVRDKYGMMALAVSSSLNQMAFAGRTTGEGLRNVVVQTAMVATSILGKGGPWGAAIAVGLLTVNTLFDRVAERQKKLEEDWKASLTRMINEGDLEGLKAKAFELDQGTAANNYQDGIKALQARLEAMGGLVELNARWREQNALANAGVEGAAAAADRLKAQITEVRRLRTELQALTLQYAQVSAAMLNPANARRTPPTVAPITVGPAWLEPSRALPQPSAGTTRLGWQGERFRGITEARGVTELPNQLKMDPSDFAQSAKAAAEVAAQLSMRTREEIVEQFRKDQSELTNGIADTLAAGITAGIAAAITSGNIGDAIRGLSSTILAGLGQVFADIAVKLIMQAQFMATFMKFINANPWLALAAATAMLALARTMGGRAGGSGGGGYGGGSIGRSAAAVAGPSESTTRIIFGQNSVATAAGMTPRQAINVTIIGPDDPNAQRGIQELLRKSQRRGEL